MLILRAAKQAGALLGKTFAEWTEDHGSQYGAALACYVLFSLAPIPILAVIYKLLARREDRAEGRLVRRGSRFLASCLLTIGRVLIGWYLGSIGSVDGTAGSLIVFLFWVYYSSRILLFGAE